MLASESKDLLYDRAPTSYWNAVEVNGAILLPCLAVMRPLLRKMKTSAANSHEPLDGLEDLQGLELERQNKQRRRFSSPAQPRPLSETPQDGLS